MNRGRKTHNLKALKFAVKWAEIVDTKLGIVNAIVTMGALPEPLDESYKLRQDLEYSRASRITHFKGIFSSLNTTINLLTTLGYERPSNSIYINI